MSQSGPVPVEIRSEADGFRLYRAGKPYFIRGARTLGARYIEKVAAYGGNSIRIAHKPNARHVMDAAEKLGLTVLFGLPVQAERDGFDYSDEGAVQRQLNHMIEIVKQFRDHPALLAWVIGNELDHIPGDLDFNLRLWDAINDIARMIHVEDPHHPAMTVIGTGRWEKVRDLVNQCPDLDMLGVNTYQDIGEVPEGLRSHGWHKPYAVTEWGPTGHWQTPKTKWGAAIEETTTEKARVYQERYETVIASDPMCVGSYAFLWASNRQETTHTWYNMFFDDGTETGPVEVMEYLWTGKWRQHRCPLIDSLLINGKTAYEHISLSPKSVHTAQVNVSRWLPDGTVVPVGGAEGADPDALNMKIVWELVPENHRFGDYAGRGETKPPSVPDFVRTVEDGGLKITFETPAETERTFRLYAYVYDSHGNIAHGNVPFYVMER